MAALNIKDPEAVRLASEVAALTGESKTRAVRVALRERKERLDARAPRLAPGERLRLVLEGEIWPLIPGELLGKPVSRAEREGLLGYGEHGV